MKAVKYFIVFALTGCSGDSVPQKQLPAPLCDTACQTQRSLDDSMKKAQETLKTEQELSEKQAENIEILCYLAGQRNLPKACPPLAK